MHRLIVTLLAGPLLDGINSEPGAAADTAYFDQLRERVRKGKGA